MVLMPRSSFASTLNARTLSAGGVFFVSVTAGAARSPMIEATAVGCAPPHAPRKRSASIAPNARAQRTTRECVSCAFALGRWRVMCEGMAARSAADGGRGRRLPVLEDVRRDEDEQVALHFGRRRL